MSRDRDHALPEPPSRRMLLRGAAAAGALAAVPALPGVAEAAPRNEAAAGTTAGRPKPPPS